MNSRDRLRAWARMERGARPGWRPETQYGSGHCPNGGHQAASDVRSVDFSRAGFPPGGFLGEWSRLDSTSRISSRETVRFAPGGAQGRARCQRCRVRCPGGQDGPFLCPRQCGVGQHIPGMIKYRSGMQNGVQIVNIFIKAAVWIGHIVLLHSFRFGTQNDLEKRKTDFKTAPKKIWPVAFSPPRAGPRWPHRGAGAWSRCISRH